jgi:hypothetical protein
MERALHYLGSAKNIVGCVLALGGLVLHFVGLLGPVWPAVVVALYLIGALVVPSPRAEEPRQERFNPERVQRALDGSVDLARGRLPADLQARVGSIRQRVLELLPRAADLPGGTQDLYVLQRTAGDYLPSALRMYLALPPNYAASQVLADGRTPVQVLRDQLQVLDEGMAEIAEAVHQRDSDRLVAQGRFLEERFGRGPDELTLPRPGRGSPDRPGPKEPS